MNFPLPHTFLLFFFSEAKVRNEVSLQNFKGTLLCKAMFRPGCFWDTPNYLKRVDCIEEGYKSITRSDIYVCANTKG